MECTSGVHHRGGDCPPSVEEGSVEKQKTLLRNTGNITEHGIISAVWSMYQLETYVHAATTATKSQYSHIVPAVFPSSSHCCCLAVIPSLRSMSSHDHSIRPGRMFPPSITIVVHPRLPSPYHCGNHYLPYHTINLTYGYYHYHYHPTDTGDGRTPVPPRW